MDPLLASSVYFQSSLSYQSKNRKMIFSLFLNFLLSDNTCTANNDSLCPMAVIFKAEP